MAKSTSPVVECRNVVCNRGKRGVLHEVSLALHPGEVVALVGPNGAGKSTLLSVLAGDLKPSSGDITILGEELSSVSVKQLAHRRAVLTQSNHVGFEYLVREVIAMGRAPWVRTPQAEEDAEAIAEAVNMMGVAQFLECFFNELSGGERASVGMARILAQRTPIIMLDEPTAALDIQHQERLMTVVRQRARTGVGALVVLHDLNLAVAYADTVAVMHQGTIINVGAPHDVLTVELLSTVYHTPVRVVEESSGEYFITPDRSVVSAD